MHCKDSASFVLFAILHVLIALSLMRRVAVGNSTCRIDLVKREAHCNNLDLFSVPKNLPGNTELLDLSNNKITTLYNSSFLVYKHLRVLAMIDNNISIIESGTFLSLPFLQSLDLSQNFLLPVPRWDMFVSTNLKYIGLETLNISYFSDDLFRVMTSPSILSLDFDYVEEVNWTECHNVSFHYVSLGYNCLEELSEQSFVIDCIVDTLDLTANPITLVSSATISSLKVRNLIMDLVMLPEIELRHLFEGVGRECGPQFVLYFSVVASALCATLAIILIYYNRWKISYGLFLCKIHFIGYREIVPREQREDFDYAIQVIFHDEDEEWTNEIFRRGLEENLPEYGRLAIGDEALRLGMYYLDSVNRLVENSFKVVFLISANALRDHMFLLKFRIALDHVNEVQIEKIVLVFLEEIPNADLPFLVRLFLSDNRAYLMWPQDLQGQAYFWEKLGKYMNVNRYCNPLVPP
ncbi:toll-like receptor 10 [Diadema antillarum]|uniref:toll-like receptor 10 n=1 Tax=Diadema antillarum TaxID=105358 RepID=UPI003A89D46C